MFHRHNAASTAKSQNSSVISSRRIKKSWSCHDEVRERVLFFDDSHYRRLPRFACCLLMSLTCLCSSGFAFDLKCSKLVVECWLSGNVLTCHVKDLNVTKKGEIMNPIAIASYNQMKGLEIHEQIVHFMPKFTESLAQSLEALLVDSCHLKDVSKEDLQQFSPLKLLSLANNDLEKLDGDLFDFMPRIEVVSFRGNEKLKYIGPRSSLCLWQVTESWKSPADRLLTLKTLQSLTYRAIASTWSLAELFWDSGTSKPSTWVTTTSTSSMRTSCHRWYHLQVWTAQSTR